VIPVRAADPTTNVLYFTHPEFSVLYRIHFTYFSLEAQVSFSHIPPLIDIEHKALLHKVNKFWAVKYLIVNSFISVRRRF